MAVAEDASSPAAVHQTAWTTATVTTAAFTPPNNSLILVMTEVGHSAAAYVTTPTLTATATGVTFTSLSSLGGGRNKLAYQAVSYGYVTTSPGSITVTATRNGTLSSAGAQLTVRVLTGAATVPVTQYSTVDTGGTEPTSAAAVAGSVGSQMYVMAQIDGNCTETVITGTTSVDIFGDATDDITFGAGKSTALTSDTASHTYGFTNNRANTANDSFVTIIEVPPSTAVTTPQPLLCNSTARRRASNW